MGVRALIAAMIAFGALTGMALRAVPAHAEAAACVLTALSQAQIDNLTALTLEQIEQQSAMTEDQFSALTAIDEALPADPAVAPACGLSTLAQD